MEQFKCLNCGAEDELSYEKWIKFRTAVLIQPDGLMTYFDQDINDNEVLGVEGRFICSCCGKPPMLYGNCIVVENELKDYLQMSFDQRAEMQAEFEQREEEIAQSEEQRIREEEITCAEEQNLKEVIE